MTDVGALVIHPAVQFYRLAIVQMRTELREVLCQYLHLVMDVRPYVLDRYAELFGELEHTLQVETLRTAQVQRLCELVELYRRRGEPITDDLLRRICQLVEREHRMYRDRVQPDKASSATQQTSCDQSRAQQTDRARLCAQLYRELVKYLHPDRDGDADLFARFWSVVQDAYQTGDLQRLRAVHSVVCIEAQYRVVSASVEEYSRVYRRLLYRLDYERRRLERIAEEEPIAAVAHLDDPTWIAQRRAALQQQIERQRRLAAQAIEHLRLSGAGRWEEHLRSARADHVPDEVFQDTFFEHTYFSPMRA
jgi:hypothetical protein